MLDSARAVLELYGADQDGSAHAIREWRALRHLSGTACRAPGALELEPDPGPLGRPFSVMDHISGGSFWSTYDAAPDVGARAALLGSSAQPLVALHALDAMQLEPAADQAHGYGAIDVELEGLHRDDHPWNAVVDAEGRAWVLDRDRRVGDSRLDVAWTLHSAAAQRSRRLQRCRA